MLECGRMCVCVCVCVCEMLACVQRGKRKPSTFNRISPIFLVKPAFTDFYFIFYFFPGTCGQQREEAADMKQKLHQLRG